MKARSITTKGIGKARRYLALAALALFGHAVALHLLHGHALATKAPSHAFAAALSRPHDEPARQSHSGDDCPACQLQHGFAFLDAAPAVLCLDGAAPVGPEFAALSVAHRIAEGSAPSRAPPVL